MTTFDQVVTEPLDEPPWVEVRVLEPGGMFGIGGGHLPVTTAQRRLLERLALAAPRAVSIPGLAEALWDGDPPTHHRAAIHNQVSRVRAVAGDGVVLTTPSGYRLGARTDLQRLADNADRAELLAEAGAPDQAFALAQVTLEEWSETAYPALGHLSWVVSARRTHQARRRGLENTRLASGIALQRAGWSLAEAERLAGDFPHDERRQALLAEALALAGRRGEALAVLSRVRRRLREDLGLEAGPILAATEDRLLHPSAAAPSRSPHRISMPDEFVGREQELRRVLAGLVRVGRVRVQGEPGAGVSRLLVEVVGHLRALGFLPVHVSALDHLDSAVGVLRAVVDELGVEPESQGVLAGFSAVVARVAERVPVALVIDDAEALGGSALSALVEAAQRDRVLLIEGSHDVESADEPAVEGMEIVALRALGRDAIGRVAVARTGEVITAAAIDRLLAYTGGNPLLLDLVLSGEDALLESPEGNRPLPRVGRLATTLLRGLDPAELRQVERAAVAGDGFPAYAFGRDQIPAGIVEVRSSGGLQFRHGALRDAVYAQMVPARREELHLELARLGQHAGATAAVVARQLVAAGPLAPIEAAEGCRAAADEAARQGAHRDAVTWLESALTLSLDDPRTALKTRIRLGDELRLAGAEEHVPTLVGALEEALDLGDEELVAAACFALLQLGGSTMSGSQSEAVTVLTRRALKLLKDPRLRAPVCGAASLAVTHTEHAEGSRELFAEAERLATSDVDRAHVLPFAYMALGMPSDLPRRRLLADELLAIGRRLGDPVAEFEAWHLCFSVRIAEGDGAALRQAAQRMVGLVEQVGDVGRRWAVAYTRAAVAHLDGDLDEAERIAADAAALFGPVSPSRAFAAQAGQLLPLRLAQGRLSEIVEVLEVLVADQPGVPAWHAALALATAEGGGAKGLVAKQAALALDRVPEDSTWLATHVVGARAVAAAGARDLAPRYLARLVPFSGMAVWQGTCCYGPVDTAIALLQRAAGDTVEAVRSARQARAVAARLGAVPFLAELAGHDL